MRLKTLTIGVMLTAMLILASVHVTAFAISMSYLEDKTLILYPGAEADFQVTLQNMAGTEDEKAQVTIQKGFEIATITDKANIYNVPKGTKDTKVNIRLSLPNDAPLGAEWKVIISATPVTEKEGGMVQIATGVSDYFNVKAGHAPEKLPAKKSAAIAWIVGIISVLCVAVLLFLAIRRKRKSK